MIELRSRRRSLLVCCALLAASAPYPTHAQLHLGLEGGWDSGCKDAVEGFPETTFEGSRIFGASLGYRFRFGLDLELAFVQVSPRLTEGGTDLGEVTLVPLLVRTGFWILPRDRGFGGRIALGFGYAAANFEKGPFLTSLERQSGATISVWNRGGSFAFDTVLGAEYFVTRWVSLGVDGRLLVVRRGTRWAASGPLGSVPLEDIDSFVLTSLEASATLRIWFGR